jgi:hypothetical protein
VVVGKVKVLVEIVVLVEVEVRVVVGKNGHSCDLFGDSPVFFKVFFVFFCVKINEEKKLNIFHWK